MKNYTKVWPIIRITLLQKMLQRVATVQQSSIVHSYIYQHIAVMAHFPDTF